MHIIVGLGNPGLEYQNTRHNVGFKAIDYLAEKFGINVTRIRFKGLTGEGWIEDEKVVLVKPQTFMNLSGECVSPLSLYYKAENIIILYDDVYIDLGSVRFRMSGSDGGHNGMKSIIKHLGTNKFPRVRIGIGPMLPEMELERYVLGKLGDDEEKTIQGVMGQVLEKIRLAINKE